ncbi:MAG: isoprenylcysteine carboxylmethyltransferase family protein, partial [Acidobacteriales bacterium]|nr:isoprenylcysteine carboxylmethyltransferase family protein [Terriglobales bacterium]
PASARLQGRPLLDFLVRRRARISLTVVLALAVDHLGGRILEHNLANVHDTKALFGLAFVLAGLTLLTCAVDPSRNHLQLSVNATSTFARDLRYIGLFASMLGFCMLIDDPKNVWLVLGPCILLDLIRVRREDSQATSPLGSRWEGYSQPVVAAAPSWLNVATGAAMRLISRASSSIAATPQSTRPTAGSRQDDWFVRSRNYAPLLIVPVVALAVIGYNWPFGSLEFHEVWEIRCLLLSFVGLAIRILAAGQVPPTLSPGRSRHPATSLDTSGMYSIVRHPRYLGDYCIGLGAVLIPFVWWLPVVYTLAFGLYYQRIITIEEQGLRSKFGERFDQWAATTPALIPRLTQWRPTRYPFSFRAALIRERTGLILVIALHSSVEWLEHLVLERRVMLEVFWIVLAGIGLTTYLLIRHLEGHLHGLHDPAR